MAIALRLPDNPSAADVATAVRAALAVELARIDVAVSSVSTAATARAEIS